MSLKFRLKGLAETFVENLNCPCCGHDGGEQGDHGFSTDHTRVTYQGIIVVIECIMCAHVFVPNKQKHGIINSNRLREAVDKDSINTGQPILMNKSEVSLEVEKMNAERSLSVH